MAAAAEASTRHPIADALLRAAKQRGKPHICCRHWNSGHNTPKALQNPRMRMLSI